MKPQKQEQEWKEIVADWEMLARKTEINGEYIFPITCLLKSDIHRISCMLYSVTVSYDQKLEDSVITLTLQEDRESTVKTVTLIEEEQIRFVHGKDASGKYIFLKNLNI